MCIRDRTKTAFTILKRPFLSAVVKVFDLGYCVIKCVNNKVLNNSHCTEKSSNYKLIEKLQYKT